MSISRNDQFGMPILTVRGHLGTRSWPMLFSQIKALSRNGYSRIALDLSWVTRMGPSQALMLVDVRERLSHHGRVLSIVGLSPVAIEAMGHVLIPQRPA